VHLNATDLLALPEQAMRKERGGRVGMIFQEPQSSLNPVMTVGTQIAEAVRIHDPEARGRVRERVVELLRSVGIPDPERRSEEYPHQLSGGMKQRVMIAMALAGRPKLLIADEPTTALDVTIQAQVLALLKDLQRQSGMAVLLITHDLGVVAEVADRVAVMYAGQVVEQASVREFFRDPRHPYSRKLFHSLPEAAKRGRRLAVIQGTVPPLDQEFHGCRFEARCDWRAERCRREVPAWLPGETGRGLRCHFPELPPLSPEVIAEPPQGQTADAAPLLEVEGLRVHFPIHKGILKRVVGQVKAVDGVSLAIPAGRTLALVGESGCGKTTAGKAILQLLRPTGGSVRFAGRDWTTLKGKALRQRRREMQIIFQDPFSSMNPRMLVEEIVAEGMLAQGLGGGATERAARVVELLRQVGLPAEAAARYPHEFSGGQRQRICVARALAVRPRLIVCDEPTSALDVSVQAQILNLLGGLQRELGLSYLFITHDLSVVAYLAHEVAVMYLGRIVEQGSVGQILDAPRHPYTQALLAAAPRLGSGLEAAGDSDPERRPASRLSGDLPSPANPPAGCHFHPRCPQAIPECREAYPETRRLGDGRLVCCLRVSADA
jgi:peptide/nickel transport system ATP-binding protein